MFGFLWNLFLAFVGVQRKEAAPAVRERIVLIRETVKIPRIRLRVRLGRKTTKPVTAAPTKKAAPAPVAQPSSNGAPVQEKGLRPALQTAFQKLLPKGQEWKECQGCRGRRLVRGKVLCSKCEADRLALVTDRD